MVHFWLVLELESKIVNVQEDVFIVKAAHHRMRSAQEGLGSKARFCIKTDSNRFTCPVLTQVVWLGGSTWVRLG